jgi:hypothetical protein
VAAVDVEGGAQLVKLGEQALGHADRQAGDLDLQGVLMLAGGLDHHHVPAAGEWIHSRNPRNAAANSRAWSYGA